MSLMDVVRRLIQDSLAFYTVNVGYMLKGTIYFLREASWCQCEKGSVWDCGLLYITDLCPPKPTAMDHLQTSYCVLICLSLFPTAAVTNIAVSTWVTQKQTCCSHTRLLSNVVDQVWIIDGFLSDIFGPTDAALQPRPVSSRQCYTLPNNGAGVERRTSAPPLSVSVESPRFHPHAKGKNIRLDGQLRRATRKNSFCNGITFSHRPVHLYEKVCFQVTLFF